MKKRSSCYIVFGVITALLLYGVPLFAQIVNLSEEDYLMPQKEIADLVAAPWYANIALNNPNADGSYFLVTKGDGMPPMSEFAKPFYNLGETEIDFAANRLRRFTINYSVGLEIVSGADGSIIPVQVPANGKVSNPVWAPDGSKFAFFVHMYKETHIYTGDPKTGKTRKITREPVLATLVNSFQWSSDSKHILTVLVPKDREPEPEFGSVPVSPRVQMTNEGVTQTRTFRFLLETPQDSDLLEYYSTGQIALVDVDKRRAQNIGSPGMYSSLDLSPDGQYIRVETMQRPFSYIVPVNYFGRVEEIWNIEGEVLAEVQKRKLREHIVGLSRDDRLGDKRYVSWRPDGNGLSFVEKESPKKGEGEAEDEEKKTTYRLMQWTAPFGEGNLSKVYESENNINGIAYSDDCGIMFITESEKGTEHLFAMYSGSPGTKYTIYKHKTSETLKDPGDLVTGPGSRGVSVARIPSSGGYVFLSGTKYFENPENDAPQPFIDKVNIRSGDKTRIFESESNVYESVLAVLDNEIERIVTSREGPTTVPDSYIRNLGTGASQKLTQNKDYAPEITNAQRRYIQVERVDGIKLWVRITLPRDYRTGTKLPGLFWFYPREYADQKAYDKSRIGRRGYNKNRFPFTNRSMRSWEYFVKLGYAVIQPDCPIIGPDGKYNNNYAPDLRNNLWAVIDNLDKMKIVDRDRLGIGGHSYGAFGTANAMIHTPFFKAGIAGDGCYNRTLTPLTFQYEQRVLWDAREVYINMSPLLWATQLNGALLMYHGADDPNNGTFPINSERMFHALNGLGKTAAMYMYPYEHHGPATKETLMDLWARWTEWMDKYVKNPGRAGDKN